MNPIAIRDFVNIREKKQVRESLYQRRGILLRTRELGVTLVWLCRLCGLSMSPWLAVRGNLTQVRWKMVLLLTWKDPVCSWETGRTSHSADTAALYPSSFCGHTSPSPVLLKPGCAPWSPEDSRKLRFLGPTQQEGWGSRICVSTKLSGCAAAGPLEKPHTSSCCLTRCWKTWRISDLVGCLRPYSASWASGAHVWAVVFIWTWGRWQLCCCFLISTAGERGWREGRRARHRLLWAEWIMEVAMSSSFEMVKWWACRKDWKHLNRGLDGALCTGVSTQVLAEWLFSLVLIAVLGFWEALRSFELNSCGGGIVGVWHELSHTSHIKVVAHFTSNKIFFGETL